MRGSVLFLIPARGGSVRIPRKNLVRIAGIPLVGWAIRLAREAATMLKGGPHLIVCSTEDPDVAAVARAWGATVIDRPASLATDSSTSVEVALHALRTLGGKESVSTLVLLQPTSPLTLAEDIVRAVEQQRAAGAPVVSVTPAHPSAWHIERDPGGLLMPPPGSRGERVVPADDLLLTGAFYVIDPAEIERERRFTIPGRSFMQIVPPDRSVDIDEPPDLLVARAALAARPVRPVPLGAHLIGGGRPIVIAEAGVNHDGDVEVAHRLVDAAADAGADIVKFQTFDPEALAIGGAPKAAYQVASGGDSEDQREMLRRLALPSEVWGGLQAHATDRAIAFLSTPFDARSADLLDALDVPAFKVGSGELTNLPFLADLARRGRPLLLSTGMADMLEVGAAVDAVAHSGDPPVALLHCVSAYPARLADANLRAMETMRTAFSVPVGWSDHTEGPEASIGAAALGAALIEKHLTLDRGRAGPDHRASLEPAAFAALVDAVRGISSALGNGDKVPTPSEANVAAVARRSLHWAKSLLAGGTIGSTDLVALRPGTGISPRELDDLIGRRVVRSVRAGDPVRRSEIA